MAGAAMSSRITGVAVVRVAMQSVWQAASMNHMSERVHLLWWPVKTTTLNEIQKYPMH